MSRSIVFRGKSGAQYGFQVLQLHTALKAVGGVYVVTSRTFEDRTFTTKATHQPIIVGETDDLSALRFNPQQTKDIAKRGAEHICVSAVADSADRARIAQDITEGYEHHGLQHLIAPEPPQAGPGSAAAEATEPRLSDSSR